MNCYDSVVIRFLVRTVWMMFNLPAPVTNFRLVFLHLTAGQFICEASVNNTGSKTKIQVTYIMSASLLCCAGVYWFDSCPGFAVLACPDKTDCLKWIVSAVR